MENNGYSLTDIASVLGNGVNGGNNILWIVFLFFIINGGAWGNRGGMYSDAAQQEILFNQHFDSLDNKIDRGFTSIGNGISSATFALNNAIATEGRTMQSQLADFACKTQGNVDSVRYDMANFANAINANINDKFAAIQKGQLEQTIASQAARINQLELAAQMCGVVRYPNGMTYNAGTSPFCNCGNSCCN